MSGRDEVDRAFGSDSHLRKRIHDAINATPQYGPLFDDIARYHLESEANGISEDGPASKKRKLGNGSLPITTTQTNQPREVILEARDISFSLPQRKKLHLGIAQYGTDINASTTTFAVYTRNPTTNEVDTEVPIDRFAYALRLPVPEKATKQYNFCLLPKSDATQTDPMIWTVNHGPLKSCHIPNPVLAKIASGPDDILETALDFILKKAGISLTFPTAEEFASATPESHRKSDKAYHVKAFRGSKDGFLFFLHNGIFFVFKKPLSFFAFEDVVSISYTSVLQRTFNLNIAYRTSDGPAIDMDEVQELEFSMIDQADFPGIDAYIKRHGLQDASLAESRRAAKAKSAANGKGSIKQEDEDPDDTRTELEKAQQQLEDEEDEEEEDYDPGSDGESEGSGEDDDEDEDYDRVKAKTKGRDLVAEELGSEAEDVSVSGDEEEDGEQDQGDEDEDGLDAEEEEELDQDEQGFELGQHVKNHGFSAVAPAVHQSAWAADEGMPDPEDDDQL
ncbi:hypothetical protein LTR10_016292 [Elasticomyces elasticus]|uniref:Histone chaperone RTT106/FACT complex subunit SPT16-like middle domain-containing protein n=1 Tax=Exophiala sideris TaxID=1016849 RepID=A0ABR0J5L2_9EURO|nr:hypothetical protein LTR10_016292 [Elasticomyces elasticus]KAK5028301.1 hypothetical protein LTS07_006392 [Exophiala sideris]KAK5036054.1 hypothetical protein LTR13_005624 [Exophiala sideris]KAK5057091.1 hypothetical protein LTR69_007729 [Exophiala sideris]KAK5181498.1 hypothetical protein LTR44_006293 [Eurotiomycetes sp. CCFEE 6388]